MNNKAIFSIGLLITGLLFLFALNPIQSIIIDSNETTAISAILAYKPGTSLDENNDGIESILGSIDFTLENSIFNWDANESELCSLWNIYSIENHNSTMLCSGNNICCNKARALVSNDIIILDASWDSFILSYGQFGSTYNNNVSAQILYFENISDYVFSNWSTLSAGFIDNIAPIIVLNSPANNTITNSSSVSFSYVPKAIAEVDNSMLSNCSLIINDQIMQIDNNPRLNQTNYLTASIADGTYNWHINCIDINGNQVTSESRKLTLDATRPQLALLAPENFASFLLGSGINLTYYVNDLTSPYEICSLYLDGVLTRIATISNTAWIETFSSLSSGVHTWNVQCHDEANNTVTSEIRSFTLSSLNIGITSYYYNLNSSVPIVISAPENSIVRLAITRYDLINKAYLDSYYNIYGPYPRIFQFNETEFSGTYTMKASANIGTITLNSSASFEISNSMAIDTFSKSLAGVGESIYFNATASGGFSPYSYVWNFDDNTNNVTGSYVTHSFANTETYDVRLTVKDSRGNAKSISKSISINYLIQFFVRDITTLDPIDNSEVTFDGITKYANETGYASFYEREGTYTYKVKAIAYLDLNGQLYINESKIIYINLTRDISDVTAPNLLVIEPNNNEIITSSPAVFSFHVSDESSVSCSLMISQDNSWWTTFAALNALKTDEETINASLQDGNYSWRIECVDSKGNTIISEIRNITVMLPYGTISENLVNAIEKNATELENLASEVDSAISNFESFDKDRLDAAEALGLDTELKQLKQSLANANRDLFDLRFRRANETEVELLRQEILQRIETLKQNMSENIFILQKAEYVQYPSKEDINFLLSDYLSLKNISLSKNEKNNYLNLLEQLQSTLVVTTKVIIADVEYKYKAKETYTILIKNIQLNNKTDSQFIEVIPKSIASSATEVNSVYNFVVLKNDPILKFELPENNILSYYFVGTKDLTSLQGVKSVLVQEPSKQQLNSKKITGFVIFPIPKVFSLDLTESKQTLLIAIIIILGAIYLVYALNLTEVLMPSRKREHVKEDRIRLLLTKVENALNEDSLEEAAMFYLEIKLIYTTLEPEISEEFYSELNKLSQRINIKYAEKALAKITEALALNKIEEAAQLYSLLEEAYQKLPETEKIKIAQHCITIHKRLSEVTENQEIQGS